MITDTPITNDSPAFITALREWEDEGLVQPMGEPLTPAQELEIERISAADKVMRMRRVREIAGEWSEQTRAAWARSFEILAVQFEDAAAFLRRRRVDPHELPAFLDTTLPTRRHAQQ